jgi:hypothetical protein
MWLLASKQPQNLYDVLVYLMLYLIYDIFNCNLVATRWK